MERLTDADLARMRAEHPFLNEPCPSCTLWPCDAALLLAELDRREANPPQWRGRNHQTPVPHLAGVAYGLFGPATTEEIAR